MRFSLFVLGFVSACSANGTVDLTPRGAARDAGSAAGGDVSSIAADALAFADATPFADAALAVPDGGIPTLSDDCAPGTWCWERPVPGGEPASGAAVFAGDRAVYVTPSGVLTRWEDGRWRSRVLDLPCTVRDLWAVDPAEVFLTCAIQDAQHHLVRVTEEAVELFPAPERDFIGNLTGVSRDALWATGGRHLLRFDGAQLRVVEGVGEDILLAAVHAIGPEELLVLESWGSGSGFGRLHRYTSGAWSLDFDFRSLGFRVDGPIVAAEDGLWLRGHDPNRGNAAAVHFDGMRWSVVPFPGRSFGDLHQVGTRVWYVSGDRAWVRDGGRWVDVVGFPGSGVIVGRGTTEAWVFGAAVASLEAGQWRRWSEGTFPTLGFWRGDGAGAALVAIEPAALWRSGPSSAPAEWVQTPLRVMGRIEGRATSGGGPSWLATAAGLVSVIGDAAEPAIAWPDGQRYGQAMGASRDAVAIATQSNEILRFVNAAWQTPIPAPILDDVRGQPTTNITAVHVTREGTLYVAGSIITGDKQVHLRAWRFEVGGWAEIARGMGEFGGLSFLAIAGDSDERLWVLVGDLFRARDGRMVRLEDARTLVDFALEDDGTPIGTDGVSVLTWDAASGARGPALALPQVARTLFVPFAHRDAEGRVRVSSVGGQVLRYTP